MCSRFYYSKEGIAKVISELDIKDGYDPSLPSGTINPSDRSIIVAGTDTGLILQEASFGFPGRDSDLVINARSETALTKPMFSSSMMTRRCVIPAESFFEWDHAKNKVEFKVPGMELFYLCGFWNSFGGIIRFVILTVAASEWMVPVHDRMPMIIGQSDVDPWIYSLSDAERILQQSGPQLLAKREEEQLRLF